MAFRPPSYAPKISSVGSRTSRPFFSKLNRSNSRQTEKFFSPNVTIGEPNDKYEKEADSMADHVVNSNNNATANTIRSKCEKCEEEENVQKKKEEEEVQLKSLEEDEEAIQKKSSTDEDEKDVQMKTADDEEDATVQRKESTEEEEEAIQTKGEPNQPHSNSLSSQLHSNSGTGFALPTQTRNEMEHSFGTDFSGVNIHTDSTAVQLNKDLHAQAFTHG